VWETDELPDCYKKSLHFVQEVWTASHYCRNSFGKYHDRVTCVPHIIERDTTFTKKDRLYIEKAIDYDRDCVYFLGVTRTLDPRKNVKGLVDAFLAAKSKMSRARLIIKSPSADKPSYINHPSVIYIGDHLTHEQLNALYYLSDVYVSPHHSEGWGFTLSDAMLFKKPVLATGFSGNMEYMREDNSFPLGFKVDYIRREDCRFLFKSHMKWAYPDQAELEYKLFMLYEQHNQGIVADKVERASEYIKRFDRDSVGKVIERRLAELTELC
jgi:glycosyltransferase involved in cell wall biosynthesis